MNHYSVKAETMDLRPSNLLTAALLLTGGAVIVFAVVLPMPLWIKGLLGLTGVMATLYHVAHDARRRLPGAIVALAISAKGELRVKPRAHDWLDAVVLPGSTVTPWLTVLNVRTADRKRMRSIVILPDSLDAASFRRLRVWLRWGEPARN